MVLIHSTITNQINKKKDFYFFVEATANDNKNKTTKHANEKIIVIK